MSIEIWQESEIQIKDLKDYDRNPRRIGKTAFENLIKSIKEDGYHSRIKINLDNRTIGGHQRKKVFLALGFKPTDKIKVLVSPKLLNEEEFRRVNFRDNLPYGEYDMDILTADFDVPELIEYGMSESILPKMEDLTLEEPVQVKENKHKCPECGYEY